MDLLKACLEPPRPQPVPSSVPMDVPLEDHWLFTQIAGKSDKPSDLTSELTMLRYLRHKMMESLEAHSAAARDEFQKRVMDEMWKRISSSVEVPPNIRDQVMGWTSEVLDYAIKRHFPEWDLGPRELKAIQDLIVATGKVAEQYKKIIEGMTFNINIDDVMVLKVMQEVILPAIPRPIWPQVIVALKQFAPMVGEGIVADM